MPYINEDNRSKLDPCIKNMINCFKENISSDKLTPDEFLSILGDINYVFSRVISNLMGDVSYGKIAMATGVLENIKQELYRRLASDYEDQKIISNGDIPEYKRRT